MRRPHALLLAAGLLFATTGAFYALQHAGIGRGGTVAPVKAMWLLTVIVFWFVLPLVWLGERSLGARARFACRLLLASMVARGGVELTMMYITGNWKHAYGIAHDLFSVGLCVGLALAVGRHPRWLAAFFGWCALLFCLETGFAAYLRHVSDADGTVFYLGPDAAHTAVFALTGLAVAASAVVLAAFLGRWLRAEASH